MPYGTVQPIHDVVHAWMELRRVGSIFIWYTGSILSLFYQRVSLSGSRNVSGEHFSASFCTIISSGLPVNCYTFLFIFLSSFCLLSVVLKWRACSSFPTADGIITAFFLVLFIPSFCLHLCSPFRLHSELVLVAFYSPKKKL